jgi:hypothetical protein
MRVLSAVSHFTTTSLETFIQTSGILFVRELAKQGHNYKFRIYLHNDLFQTHCATLEQRRKDVMNSTKHHAEEQYQFTVTRKGNYVCL